MNLETLNNSLYLLTVQSKKSGIPYLTERRIAAFGNTTFAEWEAFAVRHYDLEGANFRITNSEQVGRGGGRMIYETKYSPGDEVFALTKRGSKEHLHVIGPMTVSLVRVEHIDTRGVASQVRAENFRERHSMKESYMCEKTGTGTGTTWKKDELFATHHEAYQSLRSGYEREEARVCANCKHWGAVENPEAVEAECAAPVPFFYLGLIDQVRRHSNPLTTHLDEPETSECLVFVRHTPKLQLERC